MNPKIYRIESPRVLLRKWQHEDYAEFARMNADPAVMRYFPKLLSRDESDALSDKLAKQLAAKGWGFWTAISKSDKAFIGIVGLNLADELPLPQVIEVGWRLDRPHWGKGYATESAAAALHFAFSVLEQNHVAAFTATTNTRSIAVMNRLGMVDTRQNFLHPKVPLGSELREHVHYTIDREKFYGDFDESAAIIS